MVNILKNTETKKQEISCFITLFCAVLGAAFRLFYCILYPVQQRDSIVYEDIILDWIETGRIHDVSYFPLSLWLLKMPSHYFGCQIIKGGIIINVLLGLFLIITIMNSVRKLMPNNKVLLLVGLSLASHPKLIAYSCSILRENSYLFFSALVISFLISYSYTVHLKYLFGAALFAALSFLCRLEGLEFVIITNVLLLFLLLFKKIKVSKLLMHSVLFLTIFCLTMITVCLFMQFGYSDLNLDVVYQKIEITASND